MNKVTPSADGVPIHYEAHGAGVPALVFVHGWCCDRGYWAGQVEYFAQRYQVVALDLAGHGASGLERKDWTMTAFGQDVVAVANDLGLEQIVLVGHSMGGPVIIEAARRLGDRVVGVVGVDTFPDVERTRTEAQIKASLAQFEADFVATTTKFVRTMFVPESDPVLVEQIVADMSAAPPEVGIGAQRYLQSNDQNLREALRELTVPLLTINAAYKPTNIEGAKQYGLEVSLMSGVGHFVMMEDAGTFNGLLEAAVKGINN